MRVPTILMLFVMIGTTGWAAFAAEPPIAVKVTAWPKRLPVGITTIRFRYEIRNISVEQLDLSEIPVELFVRDSQGQPQPGCDFGPSGRVSWSVHSPEPHGLAAGAILPCAASLRCREIGTPPVPLARELFVHLEIPPYFPMGELADERVVQPKLPWDERISSNEVHTTFVEPTGIDKEAFEALKGNPMGSIGKLLVDYPTSTYAAYFLRASECNNRYSLPIVEIMRSRNGAYTRTEAMIDPVTGAQKLFRGDDVGNLCNKWLAAALEAHPDIWFADKLRLGLAINAVWLGEDDAAAAQFAELALKSDLDVIREAATKNLASMVAYHITKPEAIPEKLRAKLPKVELRTRTPAAKK